MGENELKELVTIKKLLVLQLLKSGVQAATIAELLNMDTADFSRMFPARKLLKERK